MLLPGPPIIQYSPPHNHHKPPLFTTNNNNLKNTINKLSTNLFIATAASTLILTTTMYSTPAFAINPPPDAAETFSNIPQTLSGECEQGQDGDCKKARIQKPKSRKAESCTIKCVTTCIRGGGGSPGEGPFNVRRPLVVFKQGFRSRHYCLVECSDICNLIRDGDDGP
ncbi:hypothetical protein Tco_0394021 [Tanacetum coccineum]